MALHHTSLPQLESGSTNTSLGNGSVAMEPSIGHPDHPTSLLWTSTCGATWSNLFSLQNRGQLVIWRRRFVKEFKQSTTPKVWWQKWWRVFIIVFICAYRTEVVTLSSWRIAIWMAKMRTALGLWFCANVLFTSSSHSVKIVELSNAYLRNTVYFLAKYKFLSSLKYFTYSQAEYIGRNPRISAFEWYLTVNRYLKANR